ncbi:MAG: HAD hydrolase family protein, partial [Simkaniaceae bacterium]|nr:HAD hydrolase family protein [Simkaniaceae bacterium]
DEGMQYIELRRKLAPLEWKSFENIEEIDQEAFPSIKTFGKREDLEYLESKILHDHDVHTSILTDPIDPNLCVFIINASDASKGDTVRRIKELVPKKGIAICAGNDMNDVTLLQAGDIKIAVGNPPKALSDIADFIAPPSNECGIIPALRKYIDG